jgi:hypothetical protein
MYKLTSPVLIPDIVRQLDELGAVCRAVGLQRTAQDRFGPSIFEHDAWEYIKAQHASPYQKLADEITKAQSHYVEHYRTARPGLSGSIATEAYSGLLIGDDTCLYAGGKFFQFAFSRPRLLLKHFGANDEPVQADEPSEVIVLRHEVAELKQQVAVLAGLVQLRTEPTPDPLAAAKVRGASYMKTEFESTGNLSLSAASEYSGRSDRMINLERNRGGLYALILEGNSRGYRYPKWQFDVPSPRLRSVLDVLTSSSISCWSMHNFLTRPHVDLDGRSPSAAIGDVDFPLERIVHVARRRVEQHQGAS